MEPHDRVNETITADKKKKVPFSGILSKAAGNIKDAI
jgi:hypothetical protein